MEKTMISPYNLTVFPAIKDSHPYPLNILIFFSLF